MKTSHANMIRELNDNNFAVKTKLTSINYSKHTLEKEKKDLI